MSVKSVLHKLVDELNRKELHDEVDQPETTETPTAEGEGDKSDAQE